MLWEKESGLDMTELAAGSADILSELARLGETRTWEPGATVVAEGEVADCPSIVHAGELRATVSGEGGRTVELNTLVAGEVFGKLMLSGERPAATVQVTSRARLTRVTRAEVGRALAERPEMALQLIQRLVQRVRILGAPGLSGCLRPPGRAARHAGGRRGRPAPGARAEEPVPHRRPPGGVEGDGQPADAGLGERLPSAWNRQTIAGNAQVA
jgi:hypothetical protein